jgi:hypothetical protein
MRTLVRPRCASRIGLRLVERVFVAACLATWVAVLVPSTTRAEDTFVIPVAPEQAPPRWVFELHTGFSFPLQTDALCPDGRGCVLRGGGGIGTSVERRSPNGFGWLVGYEDWFLDSDSVYELAVQQILRGGLRYTMPTDTVLHPVFELSLGVMGYGDTFEIETFGGLLQAFGGAEIELNETFGLLLGLALRAFTHTEFRTERDGVLRGKDGVFSETAVLEIGLTVM